MSKKLDPIVKIDRQIEDLTCRYVNSDMSAETFQKRRKRFVEKRERMVKAYKRKVNEQ